MRRTQSPYIPRTGRLSPSERLVTIPAIDAPLAKPVTRAPKRLVRTVVLAGAVLLAFAGPAAAAPACWKTLLNDWYDGAIEKTYAIACYQQAIDHLPTDAQLYSSAKDDILRAMNQAIALQTTTTTVASTTATPTTTATTTTTSSVPTETTTTATETTAPSTTTTSSGRKPPKGVVAVVSLDSGDADSFPLPLLILGGLAIFLVAAGIVGMIWRRMDRDGTGPSTP